MQPYCKEISTERLLTTVLETVQTIDLSPAIVEKIEEIKAWIRKVFDLVGITPRGRKISKTKAETPNKYKKTCFWLKRAFSTAIWHAIGSHSLQLSDICDISEDELAVARAEICKEITLLFYGEYIENIIREKLIPYCLANKPRGKHWGIGSIFYWNKHWGRAFYSFWRNNIEKTADTVFIGKILSRLPDNWKESYKPHKQAEICPHHWNDLDDEAKVKALEELKQPTNPCTRGWWIGSIINWTGEKGTEKFGKSFWSYWRTYVEPSGDEIFTRRLLPLFPQSWQENFEPRSQRECPHNWAKMTPLEIAEILAGFRKPPKIRRWSLSSMRTWEDRETGKRWGKNFETYWRENIESVMPFTIFENTILPLLPENLPKCYRPNGYTIKFHETTQADEDSAQTTDDFEELHKMVADGNLEAFQKLKRLLTIKCHEAVPKGKIDEHVIERVIHLYTGFGDLAIYCIKSVKKFNLSTGPEIPVEDLDVAVRRKRKHGLYQNRWEDELIEFLDALDADAP